ncbi:MmgE/PrpD family protein [Natrialbaceae archaeon AArc-T1-2]|uniref:MmgE/PrpD family protein n=1 Tax=Natrialbaceae archaeon AArc-T1-2 TaxID=3053904 RepID=UPI00255B0D30|nr:MmgE/PrpD family protein [Natrialbaceae archaeon AArc-T1-2]WIV68153.1 MmgE/PrpD family protein [Natrialbaceae archaeon AArc-T1-2]
MGETQELSEYVASVTYDDVPADAVDHAKTAIRDYIGVALYGSHHDVGDAVYEYVDTQYGEGDATVFRRGNKTAPAAALANGAFGHAIDYDDTFESIVIHPSSPIFAASLAAAEEGGASTTELVTGYIVGCEVAYRVGQSTYPEHYQNGWHSTGTAGSFGAVGAAASILDLGSEEVANAFGIVASSSSALKKNFGTMTKPLHAGHAAESGIRATLLARDGFTADSSIFEGEIGYNRVMTVDDAYDPEEITENLYEEWAVLDIGFKPYPSGVITHAAMDAMKSLTEEHNLEPATVESIVVTLEDAASEMLHHTQPDDALQAKFSIEFCLASILRDGRAGIHEFTDEYVQQEETQNAIKTVSRAFEPDLFGDDYAGYGAVVTVTKSDGAELREEIRYAPGSPNNPIEEDRLRQKFYECAESRLGERKAQALEDSIQDLENTDLDTFTSYLTPRA